MKDDLIPALTGKNLKDKICYLWRVSAGQRWAVLVSCALGVLSVLFSLAFIGVSKHVIDIATGTVTGSLSGAALLLVALLILQLLCNIVDSWVGIRMQIELGNTLRHRLFTRLLHSRWNELERFHTGDIVNRVEQDVSSVVGLLTGSFPSLVVTGVQLLAAFLFFCYLDPFLPWIVVAVFPLFLLGSRYYMKRIHRYTHKIRRSDSLIQAVIQESLQHRTVIKTLEQSGNRVSKLDEWQDTLRNQVLGRTRFSLAARSFVSLAFSGGYLTAFLWGSVSLSTGAITFGTMAAFLQLVGKVQRPVLDLSRLIPSFAQVFTAIDRLEELERLPEESGEESIRFAETPDVEIDNITFRYVEGEAPVFSHFSCKFPAGSCTAVMGETGRGKTTLVRMLLALALPEEGRIVLRSHSQLQEEGCLVSPSTRCNFTYVPQGNTLFSGTIRENLLMGNPEATEEDMNHALRTAVADFVFSLPDGIDTLLTEQGGGVSEGQAQRIAIARALLRPGHILLLDEATSALDPETERLLLGNLRRDCGGGTFIFITHHPAVAEECDRVVRL
ncbi:ABC transporter ATP-binding protein [uncultured Bacteroides sp.]|uniref:ABC transporter ATP-binding protein n=1 Tax=uncultured Bacteroides sp. TaxID=162156 RepID=UPI002595FA6E|nr:ABC transporter ATP-binding protein [uncultured Bacteroides sp.]